MKIHTQWLMTDDLPDALLIERSGAVAPWTADDLRAFLGRDFSSGLIAYDHDHLGCPIGHILFQMSPSRVTIRRLVVRRLARRQGVGRTLVAGLRQFLSHDGVTQMCASVPDDNLPMHLFLRAMGFRGEMVVKDPRGEKPDRYLFRYKLAEPALAAAG